LFKKQIEEADIVVINKSDTVSEAELLTLAEELHGRYAGREVLCVSALTGKGIDEWLSWLSLPRRHRDSLEIEYDAYARAEASLGWLNATCSVTTASGLDANAFAEALAGSIRDKLASGGHEIAHLKIYMVSASDFCKLSCVGIEEGVAFDKRMSLDCQETYLILNLRANAGPEHLRSILEEVLTLAVRQHTVCVDHVQVDSFSPSYPQPRHRE
jgi:hypothetical protein